MSNLNISGSVIIGNNTPGSLDSITAHQAITLSGGCPLLCPRPALGSQLSPDYPLTAVTFPCPLPYTISQAGELWNPARVYARNCSA